MKTYAIGNKDRPLEIVRTLNEEDVKILRRVYSLITKDNITYREVDEEEAEETKNKIRLQNF